MSRPISIRSRVLKDARVQHQGLSSFELKMGPEQLSVGESWKFVQHHTVPPELIRPQILLPLNGFPLSQRWDANCARRLDPL